MSPADAAEWLGTANPFLAMPVIIVIWIIDWRARK